MTNGTQLDSWLAEEETIKAQMSQGPGAGLATPSQIQGMSGIEVLQATLRGELPSALMAQTLDFMLIHVSEGCAIFQGAPSKKHLNPMGTVHGGWFATLLDSALGCAVWTQIPNGKIYTTAELSINLVRALTPQVPRVRAIGQVIHAGRTMATAEAKLIGADGTLYAHASTTCLVLDQK